MPRLSRSLGALASLSLAAALLAPSEASACGGGGFYQDVSASETVSTTGHRVVISVSPKHTVVWDQMQFKGDPQDFAWVYPVKAGTYVEVATAGWTDALHGFTDPHVQSPTVECYKDDPNATGQLGNQGCSACGPVNHADGGFFTLDAGGDQDTSVVVTHEGTIGPYDTQTISSAAPGAIAKWLTDNGYKVPADVAPVLDDYAANGFDFVAMRLSPGKGIEQMQPVRVVIPGPTMTYPMRMLLAGAEDHVALDIVVLASGKMRVNNFASSAVFPESVTWDFDEGTSDYAAQRELALAENDGKVFLTTYMQKGTVFRGRDAGTYSATDAGTDSLAAYYSQAVSSSGEGEACDVELLAKLADPTSSESGYTVVDVCDAQGNCGQPGADEIDSRDLACGDATDLAIAMIGLHPRDVWITRFEANLPRAALKDLVIVGEQDPKDVEIPGVLVAGQYAGDACATVGAEGPFALFPPSPAAPKPPVPPSGLGLIAAGIAFAFATLRRKFGPRARAASI